MRRHHPIAMKISELQEKKLPELRDIARDLGLTGYSQSRKEDLIYRILEAHAEAAAGNGGPRSGDRRQREQQPGGREERPNNNGGAAPRGPDRREGENEIGRESGRERVAVAVGRGRCDKKGFCETQ